MRYSTTPSFHPQSTPLELYAPLPGESERVLGPMMLAMLLDLFLLGLLTTASWSYWRTFNDRFKILVGVLFATNVAQSIIVTYTCFEVFARGFGKWAVHLDSFYLYAIISAEAIACFIAQIFFLERAHTLLQGKWLRWVLVSFTGFGMLACLALGLAAAIVTPLHTTAETDYSKFHLLESLIIVWKSVSVVTDLALTGTLIACLLSRQSTYADTNSKLEAIVFHIIEAQTLPLLCGIFFVAAYVGDPNSNLCLVPSFAEGKLAAISVLHVLNSRSNFQQENPHDSSVRTRGKFPIGRIRERLRLFPTQEEQRASETERWEVNERRSVGEDVEVGKAERKAGLRSRNGSESGPSSVRVLDVEMEPLAFRKEEEEE